MSTLPLPCLPSERDRAASLTAVAMGEMIMAMDLIACCTFKIHHRRSDGSCRCGLLKIQKGS